MFLKKLLELRHRLAFRLTLWYAGLFTLSSIVAFLFFYLLITSAMRVQTDQNLLKQAGVFSSLLSLKGINAVKSVAMIEAQSSGNKKIFFCLLYHNGQIFQSSNMSYWQNIGISKKAIQRLSHGDDRVFDTIAIPDRDEKVRILYSVIGPGIILQLGHSMENYFRFIENFRIIFSVTMSLLIVFAAFMGWFMARRAMSGVRAVTRTARRISEGVLDERVPVTSKSSEIDELAHTFNQMLDRIETLVAEIREMSDNIAHDLKSPLTRIRGSAEIALTTGRGMIEFEDMAASTIEECDRLLDMINTMLTISKTETGVNLIKREKMNIAGVIAEACELFRPMAEDRDLKMVWDLPKDQVFRGDLRLIQRMIANLLDNAVKYTESPGKIEINLQEDDNGKIVIEIRDSGPCIDAGDLPHIFERFYRCDQSRSETGVGLGLSLARTVARAHGGEITVSRYPENGNLFKVFL